MEHNKELLKNKMKPLQSFIGEFVIGLDLSLPEEIENKIDSTIVIYDSYIE